MDQMRMALYGKSWSLSCWRTRRLFKRRGYVFEVVDVTEDGVWGTATSRLKRLDGGDVVVSKPAGRGAKRRGRRLATTAKAMAFRATGVKASRVVECVAFRTAL